MENKELSVCHCEPFDTSALLSACFAQDKLREAISNRTIVFLFIIQKIATAFGLAMTFVSMLFCDFCAFCGNNLV
jgi:hypothetical protein